MENDASDVDVDGDDEETLANSGKLSTMGAAPPNPGSGLLCSNGRSEATAYATAELRDAARPTVEMERVQLTDPRDRITQPSSRPPVATGASSAPLPPGIAAPQPVSAATP